MKIEITHTPHPTKGYTATIWDGPDGIDEDSFVCRSLGECFEQIVMWRTLNTRQYTSDDKQKLEFLLKELKSTAKRKTCYDGRNDKDLYEYSDDHDATFDDGDRYGRITFARDLLESMGETYE